MAATSVFWVVFVFGIACCQIVVGGFLFSHRPVITAPVALAGVREPVAATIQQPLDHLNTTDTRTWEQRYFINEQYYEAGGPVFIMMGTEGPGSQDWLRGGQMMELALFYKAKAYSLEQRFHGQSRPTPDTSVENLIFSSPEQSIGDLASLVRSIRASHPSAKVIVFGGSFGGALAAWTQQEYPELVDGVVASSAQVYSMLDFGDYLVDVGYTLSYVSRDCYDDMYAGVAAARDIVFSGPNGGRDIAELFNLCHPVGIGNQMDVYLFFLLFSEITSSVVQGAHSVRDIQEYCDLITNPLYGDTPLMRLVNLITTDIHPEGCLDVAYSTYLGLNQNTSWESPAVANRIYVYQSCAHFGDFKTTTYSRQPFGNFFPVEVFIQMCTDYFSPSFDRDAVEVAVNNTNTMFGGFEPTLTNAMFVYGQFDPWNALGILYDLSPTAIAVYIEGTSHVTDMASSSIADSPDLTAARLQIKKVVGQWLFSYSLMASLN